MKSWIILAVAGVAAVGCGGKGTQVDTADAAGAADAGGAVVDAPLADAGEAAADAPPATDAAVGAVDAPAPADAPVDAHVDAAAAPDSGITPSTSGTGNVSLTETIFGDAVSYRTHVDFVTGEGVGGCPFTQVGGCVAYTCPANNNPPNVAGGTIVVSGGLLGAPISLQPDAVTHAYKSVNGLQSAFNPGDSIHMTGSGGGATGVGAFDETVIAPSLPTLTAPVLQQGVTTTVDRGADLAFSWTVGPSPIGVITVLLGAAASESDPFHGVICRFPMADGAGKVGSAALATLPKAVGLLSATAENPHSIVAGDFMVEVGVRVSMTAGPASFE